jgi:Tfp pilus assembly protein PilN
MRELEFLPPWYPALRRRRRFVTIQAWITGAFVLVLGLWMLLAERNVRAAEASLNGLQRQLAQTDDQLHRLSELQSLKQQMSQQAEVVSRLGPHLPVARLINILEAAMPDDMAILDLSAQSQEQTKQATALSAASGAQSTVVRTTVIRLHGVAPTDVDLGNFLARLAGVPYFSDIAMAYSKDRVDNGHMMREFEVTFDIQFDDPNQEQGN